MRTFKTKTLGVVLGLALLAGLIPAAGFVAAKDTAGEKYARIKAECREATGQAYTDQTHARSKVRRAKQGTAAYWEAYDAYVAALEKAQAVEARCQKEVADAEKEFKAVQQQPQQPDTQPQQPQQPTTTTTTTTTAPPTEGGTCNSPKIKGSAPKGSITIKEKRFKVGKKTATVRQRTAGIGGWALAWDPCKSMSDNLKAQGVNALVARFVIPMANCIPGIAFETCDRVNTLNQAANACFRSAVETLVEWTLGLIRDGTPSPTGFDFSALLCEPAALEELSQQYPSVSVTSGGDVDESGSVVFTLATSPAYQGGGSMSVNVSITQVGDFLKKTPPTSVSISGGGSGIRNLTLGLDDDSVDEPDGSVTITVLPGDGYATTSPKSATVAVSDNDNPLPQVFFTSTSGSPEEGDQLTFSVRVTPHSGSGVLSVSVSEDGDMLGVVPSSVTISNGTGTLRVGTKNDTTPESDSIVTVTSTDSRVRVARSASVTVRDNDCSAGQIPDGNGGCKTSVIVCPAGQTPDGNGECQCPDGQESDGNGGCRAKQIQCTAGQVPDGNGGCKTKTCPTGQALDQNGDCVANPVCKIVDVPAVPAVYNYIDHPAQYKYVDHSAQYTNKRVWVATTYKNIRVVDVAGHYKRTVDRAGYYKRVVDVAGHWKRTVDRAGYYKRVVDVAGHYKRTVDRAGYYKNKRVWVPTTYKYKQVWEPPVNVTRRVVDVPGHYKTVTVKSGYWTTKRVVDKPGYFKSTVDRAGYWRTISHTHTPTTQPPTTQPPTTQPPTVNCPPECNGPSQPPSNDDDDDDDDDCPECEDDDVSDNGDNPGNDPPDDPPNEPGPPGSSDPPPDDPGDDPDCPDGDCAFGSLLGTPDPGATARVGSCISCDPLQASHGKFVPLGGPRSGGPRSAVLIGVLLHTQREWVPPTYTTVWVPATYKWENVWVPPKTAQRWVPTTYKTVIVSHTPGKWVTKRVVNVAGHYTTKRVWVPPTYTNVWVATTYKNVWVPPTYTNVWVKTTYKNVWVPPTYTDVWVATTYKWKRVVDVAGHYKTKRVLVKAAWTEKVLVKAAWTEKVLVKAAKPATTKQVCTTT